MMENNLKNRIKCIRNYLNISRRSFGEKLGISEATIRRWENGSAKRLYPSTVNILISSLLNINIICSAEWISKGTGSNPKKIIDVEKKLFEIITLPGSNNNFNHTNFEILAKYNSTFFGYIDKNEKYIWINNNWRIYKTWHSGNGTYTPFEELVGKKVKETITSKVYDVCKPYIDKALKGNEVVFEIDWEFVLDDSEFMKLTYIPNKYDDEVIGIYILANYMSDENQKDITEILPTISIKPDKYIADEYIYSLKKTEELFIQNNIIYNINCILKIAYHLYCYTQTYGSFNNDYADSIIKTALKARYLTAYN